MVGSPPPSFVEGVGTKYLRTGRINSHHYMERVSAQIAEVKFQPGKPGSHLTGLKISHVIMFSPGSNRVSIHSLPDFQAESLFVITIFSTDFNSPCNCK